MIGKIIQNYRIEKNIGEGGMGDVYLAKHLRLDKKVAIKILNIDPKKHKDILTRFEIEAKMLNKLKHKNIVELYDYNELNGIPYIIMEYIDGIPLDEYIKKISGPIPEEKATKYMFQMLEALEVAHNAGIVHRDIKPSNFILDKDDNIKVLDFGIAKMVSETENHNLTKIGQGIGTLPYMSPEQVLMTKIYRTTDIYSLGVNLHEMITAQEPYNQNLTRRQIEDLILKEPLARIKSIYPPASDKIQAIIDKAMQKNPDDRFQSCKEFADALASNEIIKTSVEIENNTTLNSNEDKKQNKTVKLEENNTKTTITTPKTDQKYTKTTILTQKPEKKPTNNNNLIKIIGLIATIVITFAAYLFFTKVEYKVQIIQNETILFERNYEDSTKAINIGKVELNKIEGSSELTVKTDDELIFRKVKKEEIAENKNEPEEINNNNDENIEEIEKPVTPKKKKVVKSKIQVFTPTSFQDNFRIIANSNYDFNSRQAHVTKFLKKFTTDAAVFVYKNGEKVGTEAIKKYLQTLMFTGKKVTVSVTGKNGTLVRDIEVTEN